MRPQFSSISALCRLQGAGPDLLPMVVLAGLRVRRSQIIQYYNRLIGERFILIYANFYCVAFASPGTALYCRGLVLASGFLFCFFLSGAFLPSATLRFPEPREYEHVCFHTPQARVSRCGPRTLVAPVFFFFAVDFSTCAASGSTPAVSSLRQGCALSFRVIPLSVVPVIRASGSE